MGQTDSEMLARIEALEMVAVDLLVAARSRVELGLLLAANDDCLALRSTVRAFPPGFQWADEAWRWRQRLLRLALDATS